MKKYIELMRPKHYLKNALIFFPLFFSGKILDGNKFLSVLLGFIAFCFVASAIYIINDIKDKEKDALHEIKKNRPIASGNVSIKNAIILMIVLLIFASIFQFLAVGTLYHISTVYMVIYLILNILYSFGFKNIPLLDIAILVSGFLLRVIYGASIVDIEISKWLYLSVISISFYFGLGKRRNEIRKSGSQARKVLSYYTEDFLDKNMYMCLTLTTVFYSLWCMNSSSALIWTVPMVILIAMKYSMNIEKDNFGDPIEVIFNDKILIFMILILGIIVMGIIYFLGGLIK